MTRTEIEGLADEALDTAIKYIQDALGVTTGDVASHVFSDGRVQHELAAYIAIEIGSGQDARHASACEALADAGIPEEDI